ATFNRKWALATIALIVIAGGATLAMLNFQSSSAGLESAPALAPLPPPPSDTASSAPPANANSAVENQNAENERDAIRHKESEANANAKARQAQSQVAAKPKAQPQEATKAQPSAKRPGTLRRLGRRLRNSRKDY
ncbi:MAG TPA: hypothetical protein VID27_04710, partial [Blastocatellia bacterium]